MGSFGVHINPATFAHVRDHRACDSVYVDSSNLNRSTSHALVLVLVF